MPDIDQAFFMRTEAEWLEAQVGKHALFTAYGMFLLIAVLLFTGSQLGGALTVLWWLASAGRTWHASWRQMGARRAYSDFIHDYLYGKLLYWRCTRARAGGASHFTENILAEYECQDGHLPGDCPLCGAT